MSLTIIKVKNKMPAQIENTGIEGLIVITPRIFEDERGYFCETFKREEFEKLGISSEFVQDNQSFSKKGVLRGLHFQKKPFEQGKLVRVVKGKVLDVAVDLRKNFLTYGKWFSVVLSEENKKMMWIPEGFAHGFLTLEDGTIFQYKCTNYYNKESEAGILWNDPKLNIDWEFKKHNISYPPNVSEKDSSLPLLKELDSDNAKRAILVTGGAGYVGTSVVKELAEKYPNKKIIVFDHNARGATEIAGSLKNQFSNIEIILPEKADIRDLENFEEVLIKEKPEIVVNLASKVGDFLKEREGKSREVELVNYDACVEIAKLSKKHNVKKFIHQSTVTVYSQGEEDIREESAKEPTSTYGKAKLMAENEILKLNDENFKVSALRASTVVGFNINFKYETMFNIMCVRSVFKIPFNVFESAFENEKSYLDVRDNARAIIFCIENIDKTKGQVFNISSFNATLKQILEIIKKELNEEFPYSIVPQEKKHQQVYTINSDKIKNLGFAPEGNTDLIIKKTIQGLKNKRRFYNQL